MSEFEDQKPREFSIMPNVSRTAMFRQVYYPEERGRESFLKDKERYGIIDVIEYSAYQQVLAQNERLRIMAANVIEEQWNAKEATLAAREILSRPECEYSVHNLAIDMEEPIIDGMRFQFEKDKELISLLRGEIKTLKADHTSR